MTRWTSLAAAGSLGLTLAAALALARVQVEAVHHRNTTEALLRAEELDARLDTELSRVRLGHVTHYDGLVQAVDRLRANRRRLDDAPPWVDLAPALAAYDEALATKLDGLEHAKTQHAVLRNSVRLLPYLADRHEDPAAAARTVAAVLSASVDPTPERQARGREVVATLPEGALRRHAAMVLARQPTLDAQLAAVAAAPVGDHARHALATYTRAHDRALAREARHELALVTTVALSLLSICLVVIVQLRRARDREADLARLRTRFVAMASHEFRTPLSVILSSARMLERYADRWSVERTHDHLGRVTNAVREMKDMLDRILVIEHDAATPLRYQPAPTPIGDLLRASVEASRALVGGSRTVEVEDLTGDAVVTVDARQVRHILTNLLSNAFKYSPTTTPVRLSARHGPTGLTLEVADQGIGIPPEDRSQLFQAFHRCSNAGDVGGTGLGLAMVRAWVEAHGGRIDVHSELQRGTRFVVHIPQESP